MTIGVGEIKQSGPRSLSIAWTDGRSQTFDVVELRRLCPCASCVDELTGKRTLKPEAIADDVRPMRVESVGSYALSIHFNDGHKTGIYTFDALRRMKH